MSDASSTSHIARTHDVHRQSARCAAGGPGLFTPGGPYLGGVLGAGRGAGWEACDKRMLTAIAAPATSSRHGPPRSDPTCGARNHRSSTMAPPGRGLCTRPRRRTARTASTSPLISVVVMRAPSSPEDAKNLSGHGGSVVRTHGQDFPSRCSPARYRPLGRMRPAGAAVLHRPSS
jgi:hypothetical protein